MSADPQAVADKAAEWFAIIRGPEAAVRRAEFLAWHDADPAHASAYARMGRRWDQSAFVANTAIGRSRDLRVAAVWWRQPAFRYAAAALLVVVGLTALFVSGAVGPTTGRAVAQTYSSGLGQLRRVAFADGTTMILDTDSSATVHPDRRALHVRLLKGRVRFTTGAGSHPIAVDSELGTVRAENAEFDLCLAASGLQTTIWRGAATLTPRGGNERSLALGAGTAGLVVAGGISGPTAAPRGGRTWTEGMLAFDGTRLDEAAAALNRYNRERVVIDAPSIARLRITGAFRATDPAGFADAVARMFGLRTTRTADGTIALGTSKKR